jgi:hypothetical protein
MERFETEDFGAQPQSSLEKKPKEKLKDAAESELKEDSEKSRPASKTKKTVARKKSAKSAKKAKTTEIAETEDDNATEELSDDLFLFLVEETESVIQENGIPPKDTKMTFEEFEELMRQQDLALEEIEKHGERHNQSAEDLMSVEFESESDPDALLDDNFALRSIFDEGVTDLVSQPKLNAIQALFTIRKKIAENRDFQRIHKKNPVELNEQREKTQEMLDQRNKLIEALKPVAEVYRQKKLKEIDEAKRNLIMRQREKVDKKTEETLELILPYKQFLSEVGKKVTDPEIADRIEEFKKRLEEKRKKAEEINFIFKIEKAKIPLRRISKIQSSCILRLLKMAGMSEKEIDNTIKHNFDVGMVEGDVQEMRLKIALSVLSSKDKIKPGDIIPWRTGGKEGEKYFDLVQELIDSGIEIEIEKELQNDDNSAEFKATCKEFLSDYYKTMNRNRALTFVIGKESFIDKRTGTARMGTIYQAFEDLRSATEEERQKYIANIRKILKDKKS